MGSDRRISLAIRASAKGVIDYREYDYTAEWRRREDLIFHGLQLEIGEEILRQKLSLNSSIVSSKNYEAKDPQDFIAKYYELFNEYTAAVLPWVFVKEKSSGKTTSRAFVNGTDKLIQRYKELFGNK